MALRQKPGGEVPLEQKVANFTLKQLRGLELRPEEKVRVADALTEEGGVLPAALPAPETQGDKVGEAIRLLGRLNLNGEAKEAVAVRLRREAAETHGKRRFYGRAAVGLGVVGVAAAAIHRTITADGEGQTDDMSPLFRNTSWGAFPYMSAKELGFPVEEAAVLGEGGHVRNLRYSPLVCLTPDALDDLSSRLGFRLEAQIIFIRFSTEMLEEYVKSGGRHALKPEELERIRAITSQGQIPRFALEPTVGFESFTENRAAVEKLVEQLSEFGPSTIRFASECNLYGGTYFGDPRNPEKLGKMGEAFRMLRGILDEKAPEVRVSYSPMLPNNADGRENDRVFEEVINPQLEAVRDSIDLLSATFYAKSPQTVCGLRQFLGRYGGDHAIGIDELGCDGTDTLLETLRALEEFSGGGRLEYVNIFDCHVERDGKVNAWDLNGEDCRIFRLLAGGTSTETAASVHKAQQTVRERLRMRSQKTRK